MSFADIADHMFVVLGPPIVLAVGGWLIAWVSGLMDKLHDWLEASHQAIAADLLEKAQVSFRAGMEAQAGQIALEVAAGHYKLSDAAHLSIRLHQLRDELIEKLPDAAKVIKPATGSVLTGISGRITKQLPVAPTEMVAEETTLHSSIQITTTPAIIPGRREFFDAVRQEVFGGHMVQSQVDGCNQILEYWGATYPRGDVRFLAYELATVVRETAKTMQPIEEFGRGAGRFYGPSGFYGRGLVQISLEENYARMTPIAGCDLVKNPERALEWPIALRLLFIGMEGGMYTGKKLSDYFNADLEDPVGARRIVNGTDHAEEIAGNYRIIYAALRAAL